MKNAAQIFVGSLVAFIPYWLVAWGYKALVDGGAREFWSALGLLLAVRLFFAVIETLGSVLAWRLFGKRRAVRKFVEILRMNSFPKREAVDYTRGSNYFSSIYKGDYPEALKAAACEFDCMLSMSEEMGVLFGWRTYRATEEALDIYSPPAKDQR